MDFDLDNGGGEGKDRGLAKNVDSFVCADVFSFCGCFRFLDLGRRIVAGVLGVNFRFAIFEGRAWDEEERRGSDR
jgi:hypothetical protein